MRITEKDLQSVVDRINRMTDSPPEPYMFNEKAGKLVAQIGNFHLSHAYGGVCLHRMHNKDGGVSCPIVNCHMPKRELYDQMQSFISGLEFANEHLADHPNLIS